MYIHTHVSLFGDDMSVFLMLLTPLSSALLVFPSPFMRLRVPRMSLLSATLSPSMLVSLVSVLVGLLCLRTSSSVTVPLSAMISTVL